MIIVAFCYGKKSNDLFSLVVVDDPARLAGQGRFEDRHPAARSPAELRLAGLDLVKDTAPGVVGDRHAKPLQRAAIGVLSLALRL
jgi:hypothetical protein